MVVVNKVIMYSGDEKPMGEGGSPLITLSPTSATAIDQSEKTTYPKGNVAELV